MIDRVEVFVFDQLQAGVPFHCPVGVNVKFNGADPKVGQVGRVRKYVFHNDSDNIAEPYFREELR